MPRYFFDARIGGQMQTDDEGVLLRDDLNARDHAMAMLIDLAGLTLLEGRELTLSADVRDEAGAHLCAVRMTVATDWVRAAGDPAMARLAGTASA